MLKRLIQKLWLLGISFCLSACTLQSPRHIPHYVEQIPERAQDIAKQTIWLKPKVVAKALVAYNKAQAMGYGNKHILTIIDYTAPSTHNRFWVIDLDANQVLFRQLVAHGIGSGMLYSTNFSDTINSRASSVGMYVTAQESYIGRHGYSLRLRGLEPGFNDNAWKRAIVIHGAPYVCDSYIKKHGQAGTSWGCPALDPKDLRRIINTIKGGTLIFAYGNNPQWLQQSVFLN